MRRAKESLLRPLLMPRHGMLLDTHLRFPELAAAEAAGAVLDPYQGLAPLWDEYNSQNLPGYPQFLAALARRRGAEVRSVLDIACGTGTLTARLARRFPEVAGLDASEPMLAVARRRSDLAPSTTFHCGEFGGFDLGRRFDAAVCSSNSINYVADRAELGRALAAVRDHLRPGGVFAFDTTTEFGMRLLSGHYLHVVAGGTRFALRFSYDPDSRRETSAALLPSGVETHRRIPLDPADVRGAASAAGLAVDDCIPFEPVSGSAQFATHYFFVLSRGE